MGARRRNPSGGPNRETLSWRQLKGLRQDQRLLPGAIPRQGHSELLGHRTVKEQNEPGEKAKARGGGGGRGAGGSVCTAFPGAQGTGRWLCVLRPWSFHQTATGLPADLSSDHDRTLHVTCCTWSDGTQSAGLQAKKTAESSPKGSCSGSLSLCPFVCPKDVRLTLLHQ